MFRASSGENYCIYATLVFAIHTVWQVPVSHRDSNFLLKMGTWMPETRTK